MILSSAIFPLHVEEGESSLAEEKVVVVETMIDLRCQFHQHFMSAFFTQMSFF
jgi:hypothetical protein